MKILLSVFMAVFVLTGCKSDTETGVSAGGGVGFSVLNLETDQSQEANIQKIDKKQQLSLNEIKKMTQLGMTDHKIMERIKSTGSVYYLTATDTEDLKNAGVSKRVIDYMSKTGDQ